MNYKPNVRYRLTIHDMRDILSDPIYIRSCGGKVKEKDLPKVIFRTMNGLITEYDLISFDAVGKVIDNRTGIIRGKYSKGDNPSKRTMFQIKARKITYRPNGNINYRGYEIVRAGSIKFDDGFVYIPYFEGVSSNRVFMSANAAFDYIDKMK